MSAVVFHRILSIILLECCQQGKQKNHSPLLYTNQPWPVSCEYESALSFNNACQKQLFPFSFLIPSSSTFEAQTREFTVSDESSSSSPLESVPSEKRE